jgi:hypothetical protein
MSDLGWKEFLAAEGLDGHLGGHQISQDHIRIISEELAG